MDAALGARACIALMNKTDLGQVIEASDLPFDYVVPISAKNGMGMELLEQAMDMLFADDAPCDGSLLTNARQAEAFAASRAAVDAGGTDAGRRPRRRGGRNAGPRRGHGPDDARGHHKSNF